MNCPACGHENRETARFCGECAARLATDVQCPECGTPNLAGQKSRSLGQFWEIPPRMGKQFG